MLLTALNPVANYKAVRRIVALYVKQRHLLVEMVKRDILDPHAGHVLGGVWAFLHPLFMMGVYMFLFGVVMKARVNQSHEMPLDYSAYILSGMVPWLAIQLAMAKSTSSIVSNANLVKRTLFPIEILPARSVIAAMVPQAISLLVLIIYVLATHGSLFWTYLLLPVLLLMHLAAMLGIAFVLSAVSVIVRDMKEFVQVFSLVGIFLVPVVFLPDWVPTAFKPIIYANPFSYMIWCYQDVLYFGRIAHPVAWGITFVFAIVSLAVGSRLFARFKSIFGDAL
ncbi:Teichoic acid translocation permease protein TagG [compost metagenome]